MDQLTVPILEAMLSKSPDDDLCKSGNVRSGNKEKNVNEEVNACDQMSNEQGPSSPREPQ